MATKKYAIQLIPQAVQDYKKLDGSVKKEVARKVEKLSENPFCGDSLGNKHNINLSGFYKLYACNKSIRIVYRLISPQEVEIVEIWGIGRRDKMEIYKIISERLGR